jgi:zinc/manganese transport system substrate-binding protein
MTLLSLAFSFNTYALVNILSAENMYGDVAKEIGGPHVNVISILNSPSQDPHLFTITPSTLKAAYVADVVIYNGLNYDPWTAKVLALQGQKERSVINVSSLIKLKGEDNPHIWYLPETMPLFAKHLVSVLIKIDSINKNYYQMQLNKFNQSYQIIFATIKRLKARFQDTPVIATEPVFDYMAKSIGLIMHGRDFQTNMMNDLPPSISSIKAFEDDLYHHKVRLLIYNKQVKGPITENMRNIANTLQIPVLGVSELLPPGVGYVSWIMQTLTGLEHALQQGQDQKPKAENERANNR